jgi:hypothetical protein
MHHTDQKSRAISLCLNDLAINGYRHGDVILHDFTGWLTIDGHGFGSFPGAR